ncbi:MAG: TonB-dependent receptor [candidate division KSB1 bacterium]|nr:TonB-dependent receptor [candidate division KSB1 bacterium]
MSQRSCFRAALVLSISLLAKMGTCQEEVSIQGQVIDAKSGEPVPAANVQVLGQPLGAASDEEGRFVIRGLLRGEYRLLVSHVAYHAATVDVGRVGPERSSFVLVRLEPRVILLPAVEAVGEREKGQSADRVYLDRTKIEESGASNLAEILAMVPTLTVARSSTGSTVSIRGSSPGQVLILFGDVPLNDPLTGGVDLETVPASLVESVEVIPSSESARYGSGAVGGVIVLRPRRSFATSVSFAARRGSFGFAQASPSVLLRIFPNALSLTGDFHRWAGGYPYTYRVGEEVRSSTRRNSDLRQESGLAQLSGRLGPLRTYTAQMMWTQSDRGVPGSVYALSPFARGRLERQIASFLAEMALARGKLEVAASASRYRSRYTNRIPPDAPLHDRSVPPYDSQLRQDSKQLRCGWIGQLAAGEMEISGTARSSIFTTASLLGLWSKPQEARLREASLGGAWHGSTPQAGGMLLIRASLAFRGNYARVENPRIARTYHDITPSLRTEVSWFGPITVSALIGGQRGFRLPTYGDLFYQDYQIRGNPNLLPERSFEWSAGVRLRYVRPSLDGTLRWEWFRRKVEDFITWRLGSFATFSPVNVDARMDGHELALLLSVLRGWAEMEANAQWLTAVNLSNDAVAKGKRLPFRPDYQAGWSLVVGSKRARAMIAQHVVGPRWVTEANTVKLAGYQVWDLTLSLEFPLMDQWRTGLQLQVLNATDARYEVLEASPLPGREWRLGLDVNFGVR